MPADSIWNTPSVSPRAEQLVGGLVVERDRARPRTPARPLARMCFSASAISVSVRSPRKSNLISPTFSTQRMSYCVITSPVRASR